MASELLYKVGTTQFRFFETGVFSPADVGTNWTVGTPNDTGVLTLSAIADDAGRQSTKVDLGATRAPEYEVLGCIDWTAAPTSGATVKYFWAPSTSGTQANGNHMGNSGADGAAGAGATAAVTLEEFLAGCDFIGVLSCTADAIVQNKKIGVFSPSSRYGQLVVVNRSGAAFGTTATNAGDWENHQVFNPIVPEGQ